jgi:SWI/SNF-related matrix-associated actin-dependent regulator of chromatin subfamily A member 5
MTAEQQASAMANAGAAEKGEEKSDEWKRMQSLLMQLRKCCNHPYLFQGGDISEGATDGMVQYS